MARCTRAERDPSVCILATISVTRVSTPIPSAPGGCHMLFHIQKMQKRGGENHSDRGYNWVCGPAEVESGQLSGLCSQGQGGPPKWRDTHFCSLEKRVTVQNDGWEVITEFKHGGWNSLAQPGSCLLRSPQSSPCPPGLSVYRPGS